MSIHSTIEFSSVSARSVIHLARPRSDPASDSVGPGRISEEFFLPRSQPVIWCISISGVTTKCHRSGPSHIYRVLLFYDRTTDDLTGRRYRVLELPPNRFDPRGCVILMRQSGPLRSVRKARNGMNGVNVGLMSSTGGSVQGKARSLRAEKGPSETVRMESSHWTERRMH